MTQPPAHTPGDQALTPRMTLRRAPGWQGDATVLAPPSGVLGGEAAAITAPLSLFTPAEPPIELTIAPLPQAGVLGAETQPASLEYRPDDDAVYVLLHEIHTSDGIIYDWTLPEKAEPAATPGVLSGETTLRFPINPVVTEGATTPAPGVLGVESLIGGAIGGFITKRLLQMVKSPIERALLAGVKRAEPPPRVLALRDTLQPIEGFEAWRALLPPGAERRVLLYIHGFASSTERSDGGGLLGRLAPGYDAVLGYDHPTIGSDPLQNALDLLAMIPDDVQLAVDIVAHSRGGLVARSLVELAEPGAKFSPRRLITNGTPHAGTPLADPQRWDRLISLGMTAASWLATATGVVVWLPKVLEYVLKAAAQGIFALPGVAAMTPGNEFLGRLNASGPAGLGERVHYAAVTSTFSIFNVAQPSFRQVFEALAAQTFVGAPNDLVVPTASMSAIDTQAPLLAPGRQLKAGIDHFSYFKEATVVDFVRQQLGQP